MARRTKGEGTVSKQREGYWYAQVRVGGQRYSAGGHNATEARRRLAVKVSVAAQEHSAEAEGVLTLGAYLDRWLRETKGTLKPQAWIKYESVVRVHLTPRLGMLKLGDLQRSHLADLFEGLRRGDHGKPLGDTSCHHIHATLRKALSDAVDQGAVMTNVAKSYPAPRMVHRPKVILNAEQVGAFLRVATADPLSALYTLAITTGMREGELLALYWRDVDLEAGRLHVGGTISYDVDGKLGVGDPKTRHGRRSIDLPAAALVALRCRADRLGSRRDELIFGKNDSPTQPMSGSDLLKYRFYPMLRRAGLPKMAFHDLRHTAITMLLEAGVSPHVVSEMAGHSDVATTLQLYGHVTPKMRGQAAVVMDTLIESVA